MIDWVSSLMAVMLFVSHLSSSYPSCPDDCHCYQEVDMFIANCTTLPVSSENIEILNLIPTHQRHPIELYEGQFTGFKKLKYLNLSNCSVYSVHKKSFFGVTSLIEVDLSYNNIQSLDSAVFQHIKSLISVVLRGNNFTFDSDNPFLISNTIEHLDIGDCGISSLPPGIFYGLKQLVYMEVDKNQLQTLEYNSLPRSLKHLNLSHNLIVNVPTDLLVTLKNLRSVDLSGNPVNCTCPLMNLQDHFSGIGISFENEVICSYPPKYAGMSWNKVNENELCVEETLLQENIPIKSQRHQHKYKYQINSKDNILENDKNNYYEANIQADQPFMEKFKYDPDSEILFQNDDTRAMGEMMRHEEELNKHESNDEDLKHHNSDPEIDVEHTESPLLGNDFPEEKEKKIAFDEVHTDSDHKTDPDDERENFETTTDNVGKLKEQTNIGKDNGEKSDDAGLKVQQHSDNLQENKASSENKDTETERSISNAETETEKPVISDSNDHDQVLSIKDLDTTTIVAEGTTTKEGIPEEFSATEEEAINENNNKETEEIETSELHENKNETITNSLKENQKDDKYLLESKENLKTQNVSNEEIKEHLTEISKAHETDLENEELIEDITTSGTINEHAEIVEDVESIFEDSKVDGKHIDEKLGQLKIENNEETVKNETENIAIPAEVKTDVNSLFEEKSSKLTEGEAVIHEETEKPPVDGITESDVENLGGQNVPEIEVTGTTEISEENIVTEGTVIAHHEQLTENSTEQPEGNHNIEEIVDKKHRLDLEYQPVITTTDLEIPTTVESTKEETNFSDVESTNNPIAPVELEIISPTPQIDEEISTPAVIETVAPVDLETTPVPKTEINQNETHVVEESTPLVTVQEPTLSSVHDTVSENVELLITSYPDTDTAVPIIPDNIPVTLNTDPSPTEVTSDVIINPEINTSENASVLGNIKQGSIINDPIEDDNLIGDKTLKETLPMEFEAAHVVLGSIIVLVALLVLVAVYKCATEGKKSNRSPKDIESNHGTEMQDMASLLPKPNNEEPKIISKKYTDEAPASETVSLIQDEKKNAPPEIKPVQENENSLNNNTPVQPKPLNRSATPITINPSAPIQRTRVKVGIIPESIPRTPIFVQKSYNNGVTNG